MSTKNKNISIYTKNLQQSEILKLCPSLLQFPELTNRQKAFCYFYVMNGNDKLQAAINAGYNTKYKGKKRTQHLYIAANQNLYKKNVQECIKQIANDLIGIRKETLEHNIFTLLMQVIELDICDYLEDDGTVKKKLSDIPKPIRQLISKTEVKYYGKDADVRVLTLEFLGKQWAIEKLMKYIAMIKDGDTNVNILSEEVKINMMNILMGERSNK